MVKIFDNISYRNEQKIIKNLRMHDVYYNKKDKIIDYLSDEDDIAYIKKGKIEVIKNNYNGTENIVDEFSEGELINYLNIYLNDNSVSLEASSDTVITILSYSTIKNIDINDKLYSQFFKNMFFLLNDSIKNKNERIDLLTKKSTRDKLLSYFNKLSVKSNSRNIYLPMSFSALAKYLGVDRSAMSREIGYLKDEGFINVKSRKITLNYR